MRSSASMERRTHEHWLTLIKEHEASGETLTEFCRGRGLGMPALRWLRISGIVIRQNAAS